MQVFVATTKFYLQQYLFCQGTCIGSKYA